MRKLVLICFLLTSLSANASFWYKDLEFLSMENFTVERKSDKIYIGFDYVINNPNWYAVVIKPSSLFLKIADVDCGWVRIPEKVKLRSKEKGSYRFQLVGDASKFVRSGFSSIWALLSGKGIDFNLSGKINAGISVFKRKWPMDYTYKMTFEEFLSFF
jgi:hypothetical protein